MVRTAHHRSSAGGNIEAISGTWMPSRSRTRITTRTRAPTRQLQIVRRGDRFRIAARYSNKLSNPRAATVRIRTLSLCIERNEVRD